MDIQNLLSELKAGRNRIDQAIFALERRTQLELLSYKPPREACRPDGNQAQVLSSKFKLERKNHVSETSTLITFTGKITPAGLAQIPTPPSTSTHVPVPHAAVVEALVDTLSHRQIPIVDQEFAISKDGMGMSPRKFMRTDLSREQKK